MLANQIKFSDMDNGGWLRETDVIPILRANDNPSLDGSNEMVFGEVIQGRIWFPEITQFVGSDSTALDKWITLGRPTRTRVDLYMDSQLQTWLLLAGDQETDESATDSDPEVRGTTQYVRPQDWAETTNERVWARVL